MSHVERAIPQHLRIPVVEASFARHLHARWHVLQASSRAWLRTMRLMDPERVNLHADGLRYTDLVAGYYVDAPDSILAAISDFSVWFFIWDDRHDRDCVRRREQAWHALSAELQKTLEDPRANLAHPEPLVSSFADCMVRIFEPLSPSWGRRFASHFRGVLRAYDTEFQNRLSGRVPGVAEYLAMRRWTFGHHVWLDLLELSANRELPSIVRSSAAYERAGLASQDFSALYNDLCSLPKELAAGDLHNLGVSLIHHEGFREEDALVDIRGRCLQCVADFLESEREVLQHADELELSAADRGTLRSCLFNMRNWFSSVYWFHHESDRYRVDSWKDKSLPPYVEDHS